MIWPVEIILPILSIWPGESGAVPRWWNGTTRTWCLTQGKYGFWRPVIERSVAAFLRCGDLQEGFARVRCPDCRHEMFVAWQEAGFGAPRSDRCTDNLCRGSRRPCPLLYVLLGLYIKLGKLWLFTRTPPYWALIVLRIDTRRCTCQIFTNSRDVAVVT